MYITPLLDRVLIKPIDVEDITSGGILLAQSVTLKEPRLHGIVLEIGPGRMNAAGKLIKIFSGDIGDTVIYGNVTTTVKEIMNNEKVLLISGEAIVGIVHDE